MRSLTQSEAAASWKTTFWVYRSWESNPNLVPLDVREALKYLNDKSVPKSLAYVLLRRREGMTQRELASELGVSRQWVNLMENGLESDDLLDEYWNP